MLVATLGMRSLFIWTCHPKPVAGLQTPQIALVRIYAVARAVAWGEEVSATGFIRAVLE